MKILLLAGAVALACTSAPSAGQIRLPPVKDWYGSTLPGDASALVDKDGKPIDLTNPLPVTGRQELVTLATANTAAPAATLYGGSYILNQACSAYGSVTLRYRSPDGATMLPLTTKSAPDSGGGSTIQFGTAQVVDVALSGTTGCNVTLSRVP